MCEFCTKHGDGVIWYKNAANYSSDLVSDLRRRKYIEQFFESTINDGFKTLGRLEALYKRRGRLPSTITRGMIEKAKIEHFGQVLPLEEISELVLKSASIVRMPCACRWTALKKEVRCCYAVSYTPEAWYKNIDMGYFGTTQTSGLESITPDEAIIQMKEMEKDGAIHTIWTMLTPFIGAVCNCRLNDCLAMQTLSNIHIEIMARAEHTAVVNRAICSGCGKCTDACQFDAIECISENGKNIARINTGKCFGCGLCRNRCPTKAILMIER
jgi:ferredoxin